MRFRSHLTNTEAAPTDLITFYKQDHTAELLWVKERGNPVPRDEVAETPVNQDGHLLGELRPESPDGTLVAIYAEEGPDSDHSWKTPLFMPRWASRLDLRIVDIGIERVLGEATLETAHSEGFSTLAEYEAGWRSVHTKMGTGWDEDPWVWIVRFERND